MLNFKGKLMIGEVFWKDEKEVEMGKTRRREKNQTEVENMTLRVTLLTISFHNYDL